jgi:hypothetical protein
MKYPTLLGWKVLQSLFTLARDYEIHIAYKISNLLIYFRNILLIQFFEFFSYMFDRLRGIIACTTTELTIGIYWVHDNI